MQGCDWHFVDDLAGDFCRPMTLDFYHMTAVNNCSLLPARVWPTKDVLNADNAVHCEISLDAVLALLCEVVIDPATKYRYINYC